MGSGKKDEVRCDSERVLTGRGTGGGVHRAENFSQQITKLHISSPAMVELFCRTVTFFIRSQK